MSKGKLLENRWTTPPFSQACSNCHGIVFRIDYRQQMGGELWIRICCASCGEEIVREKVDDFAVNTITEFREKAEDAIQRAKANEEQE